MPDELGDESQAVGLSAEVSGHVTGVTSSGFYLQDGSGAFNGVYVYEGSAPTVFKEMKLQSQELFLNIIVLLNYKIQL